MNFARKILDKYGWKEGEGLGKNSNGISKPLRATLKFDHFGLGADQAASDFNNHWWERVFNDAASNVEIKQEGESIKMDLKNEHDEVEISTKSYSVKKLKKAKSSRKNDEMSSSKSYGNFLQAATLTNTGNEVENPDRIEVDDIEVTKIRVLTDEELFKACGGRTAHKGARHGLKLSGKLQRLEQQEKELLAQMMAKRNGTGVDKNRNLQDQSSEKDNNLVEVKEATAQTLENKKKKKKRKHISEEVVVVEHATDESPTKKDKKNKRKIEDTIIPEECADNQQHCDINTEQFSKSSRMHEIVEENNVSHPTKKKKKSKNKSTEQYSTNAQASEIIEVNSLECVEKKKKSKSTLAALATIPDHESFEETKSKKKKKKLKNVDEIKEEESNVDVNASRKKKNKKLKYDKV